MSCKRGRSLRYSPDGSGRYTFGQILSKTLNPGESWHWGDAQEGIFRSARNVQFNGGRAVRPGDILRDGLPTRQISCPRQFGRSQDFIVFGGGALPGELDLGLAHQRDLDE